MRKIGLSLLISLIISCSSLPGIEYHLPYADPQTKLAETVTSWENTGYKIFFIFGKEDGYNLVQIVPYRDKNHKVSGLKLSKTNRKLILQDKAYPVFFDFDEELAATVTQEIVDGEKVLAIHKSRTIYDLATTLYFDKNWNFVK